MYILGNFISFIALILRISMYKYRDDFPVLKALLFLLSDRNKEIMYNC